MCKVRMRTRSELGARVGFDYSDWFEVGELSMYNVEFRREMERRGRVERFACAGKFGSTYLEYELA